MRFPTSDVVGAGNASDNCDNTAKQLVGKQVVLSSVSTKGRSHNGRSFIYYLLLSILNLLRASVIIIDFKYQTDLLNINNYGYCTLGW